jgi:hypothetical protein
MEIFQTEKTLTIYFAAAITPKTSGSTVPLQKEMGLQSVHSERKAPNIVLMAGAFLKHKTDDWNKISPRSFAVE